MRRASINSFGYGGANGHCIIDHVHTLFPEYVKAGVYQKQKSVTNGSTDGSTDGSTNGSTNDSTSGHQNEHSMQHHPITKAPKMTRTADAGIRQLVLLPFAAHNKESLKLNIDALCGAIDRFPLVDVAYILGTKRSRLPQRTFRVVNRDQPAEGLSADGKVLRSPLQPGSVALCLYRPGRAVARHGC